MVVCFTGNNKILVALILNKINFYRKKIVQGVLIYNG